MLKSGLFTIIMIFLFFLYFIVCCVRLAIKEKKAQELIKWRDYDRK